MLDKWSKQRWEFFTKRYTLPLILHSLCWCKLVTLQSFLQIKITFRENTFVPNNSVNVTHSYPFPPLCTEYKMTQKQGFGHFTSGWREKKTLGISMMCSFSLLSQNNIVFKVTDDNVVFKCGRQPPWRLLWKDLFGRKRQSVVGSHAFQTARRKWIYRGRLLKLVH